MAATNTARTKSVGNGSGSVYQEGARTGTPGRWVAQIKIDDKYRRTYHPSEAKAKRALRTMLANVERGEIIANGNMTLGELLERWRTKVLPAQNLSPPHPRQLPVGHQRAHRRPRQHPPPTPHPRHRRSRVRSTRR